jgi:hypothetical protein
MDTEPLQIIGVIIALVSLLGAGLAHARIRSSCCGSTCSVDPVKAGEEARPKEYSLSESDSE